MQGPKTHEQHKRILERKDDMPDERLVGSGSAGDADAAGRAPKRAARQSEFPVSRGGLNQESRDHNKHNNAGQGGHKPQQHSPAQEKH